MSIGVTLTAARQEAGLSVDDVATATRIRGTLIRAIEADNFEPCGGATYARGHIRNIAAAVGIDPAPLVAEFNQSQGPPGGLTAHQILDRPEIGQRARTAPNLTAAMLVTAILLAAVAFVSLFTGPDGVSPKTTAIAPTSALPVVVPQPEPTAVPTDGAPPVGSATPEPSDQPASSPAAQAPRTSTSSSPAVVAFNGVTVRVSITGARSWVRATDLSNVRKVLYQGVLERGAVRDFTATSKISLTFGDAGAVGLTVNGRDLGAPGGPGAVVTAAFVPGDPGAG